MRALNRKLLRDLSHMKGQAVAIAAVIGCGLAVFIGARTTLYSLKSARATYYDRSRFADVFTGLNRAPEAIARRAAEIPGVAAVDSRVVEGVTLDIPGLDEPAVGKLVSLPDRGEPNLNLPYLKSGRFPDPNRGGEVLAEEAFVSAHGFRPGDSFEAVLNGRLQTLTITGVGLSPEYLTTIQPGSLFPDDKRFGIFWMPRRQLASAFTMEGAFNDLTLSLMPGANEAEVIRRLDRLLAPHGGLGANGRDQHLSHRFISDELAQLRIMSLVPPSIFLGVAAFLLSVAIRRLLSLQREQIAALKAFGYANREIALHYAGYAIAIVALGTLLGFALGAFMGKSMTAMCAAFYRFPNAGYRPDFATFVLGAALSFAIGIAGVAAGVRQAVRIPPAEAMRPEPPPVYRPSLVERLGWHRWLAQAPRMILRELSRRPLKAALTAVGIAFSCAILVVGNFGKDAIDYLVAVQFGIQERQDATVTFHDARPVRALEDLRHLRGVTRAEPFRAVPVRVRNGQYSRQTAVRGLGPERDLYRLIDTRERVVDLPGAGVLLSAQLAKILHVDPGDTVEIEVLEGERPTRRVPVGALVEDFSGIAAYMDLAELNALMREGPSISGAYLAVTADKAGGVFRELKRAPRSPGCRCKKWPSKPFSTPSRKTCSRCACSMSPSPA